METDTIKHPDSDWHIIRVPAGHEETEEAVAELEDEGFEEYARTSKYVSLRKRKSPVPEATPAAIEKAGEEDVDLHDVTPSGGDDGERITYYDVTDHIS